ncbi:MAG: DinB family protein [Planctomycetota bacterium]|nr:DinB family protein [Planctomycetota bacterium]MCZ6734854.1 DinB family protein [Planctomycetota bacterium]
MSDILNRLLGHNAWTTRQLVERARALTAEQYVQRFELGPGSVHDTLRHIISVMFGWADEIAGRPRRPSLGADGKGPIRSVDELLKLLDDAAKELEKTADLIVDQGTMDEMMSVTYEGRSWEFTRGTALAHVLTHGMHHRAQLFNMMRRLGVAVDIDGDAIEWEIGTRAAARTE